jgi:LPS-assembly protein
VAGAASPGPGSALLNAEWELCGEPGGHDSARPRLDPNDQTTYLDADQTEASGSDIFRFTGDVDIRRGDQQLEADKAVYDKNTDIVDAKGNVRYRQGDFSLDADSVYVELEANKGTIENSNFSVADKHARGDAESIFLEGKNKARLKRARYTTCNPGNDDWYFSTSELKLNQETGIGTARDILVEFKGVPIFYFPYLTFPLNDERKSGFLTPSFGGSDEVGSELITPYYWNIAPNRDATITPRITSKRGVQLLTEFRYLNPTNGGQINLEYLPDDDEFGDDRHFIAIRHQGNFAPRWRTYVNINDVSDDSYFEDLGTDLNVASTTHLERRGEVTYSGDFWSATGRVQGFQTIDETIAAVDRPYDRLPQFLVNANLPRQWGGSNYLFQGEYVSFDRDDSVTGDRFDIQPGISLPLRNSSGFITPTLSLRHTQYALNDELPGTESSPSRTLPIFSVDSGVTFEREASWGGTRFQQTLEPRLFYLYVPFRDQSDIPIFDTTLLDFSFARLFQTNRFAGTDRVGDANQLTLALSTRLFDDNGTERFNAKIGQIRYFRDREVILPDGVVETENSSDVIAEAIALEVVPNWSAITTLQWDPQDSRVEKTVVGVRYQTSDKRFFDLSYRYLNEEVEDPSTSTVREQLEQIDVSALWPLSKSQDHQWNAVGRLNYSLTDDRTLEFLAGVEYDTCCWAFRIANRSFVNEVDGDSNNSLFLQLELKGLTRFGNEGKESLGDLLDSRSRLITDY